MVPLLCRKLITTQIGGSEKTRASESPFQRPSVDEMDAQVFTYEKKDRIQQAALRSGYLPLTSYE